MNHTNLSILTMNVRGIRNTKKRKSLFQMFRQGRYDIIALQETHLVETDVEILKREWGENFHLSAGTTRSKGLLTLFSNNISMNNVTNILMNDRILVSFLNSTTKPVLIINIYGPNSDKEKCIFINHLQKGVQTAIKNSDCNNIVLLGDCNIVLDNNFDIVSGLPHSKTVVDHFNSFVNQMDLFDIWRLKNPKVRAFTWSCKHPTFTARRLDYIFLSSHLMSSSKKIEIKNIGLSDHKAVHLIMNFAAFKRGPSTFKFNTQILKDLDFINEIKLEIKRIEALDLNPHLKWEYVKIQIKALGMIYGRKKASEKNDKKRQLIDHINKLDAQLIHDPHNINIQNRYYQIKQQLEIYLLDEAEGAKIRSGIKWAEEGEKCTKFFLNLEKKRSDDNTIFQLLDEPNNTYHTAPDEILKYLKNHFSSIYNPSEDKQRLDNNKEKLQFTNRNKNNQEFLDEDDINLLDNEISENEVLRALKASNNKSAPGLDGLPCEVYKVLWIDIKNLILESFNYSYTISNLCDSQKTGMICLIHKGKGLDTTNISNWRPITLTNFDYKLLAKTLALRLNYCIDKCIHSDQHAFMKGRPISEMIRIIDDITEWGKNKKSDNLILSIDYAKAFDTISTTAILDALNFFGMGERFIHWIKILLDNRKSCIRNGGFISEYFKMGRGVRQGCPISPLLFILTVELLAINIRYDENIKGIRIPGGHRALKIQQYADDTTLFLRDLIDFREILSKIKAFGLYTGLELNKNKSNAMYISNTKKENTLKYGIKFLNKLKILGVIFSNVKSTQDIEENVSDRINKLERICTIWSKRKLTIIGKITILKSFGISIFIHIMQSIGISRANLDKINKIMFSFLWKNNYTNKKTTEKVKRTTVCTEKKYGGLGMIDIHSMQHSFLLDWAIKYINGGQQFWNYTADIFLKKIGGRSSFKSNVTVNQFKGIQSVNSIFWKNVLCTWLEYNRVDNNSEEHLNNFSPIFNNSNIKYKNETLFIPHCLQTNIRLVGDIMNTDNNIMSFDEFKNLYGQKPDSQLVYNIIFNSINRHKTNIDSVQEDVIYFRNIKISSLNRKGIFKIIRSCELPIANRYLTKKYNFKMSSEHWLIPFKCSNETRLQSLQWKILHGIFPTGTLLTKMKLRANTNCQFCDSIDTLQHFFYDCPLSKVVWKEIERKLETLCNRYTHFSAKNVLIGFDQEDNLGKNVSKIINLMILIGKNTISKAKYHKNRNIRLVLEQELNLRKYTQLNI